MRVKPLKYDPKKVEKGINLAIKEINNGTNLPVFNKKPRNFKMNFFWSNNRGGFSKRAFFFSAFGFCAVLYIILCATPLVKFDSGLSLFILGCNAAFGLNYYKNEVDKDPGAGGPAVPTMPGNVQQSD
jgi:hypothetical protein